MIVISAFVNRDNSGVIVGHCHPDSVLLSCLHESGFRIDDMLPHVIYVLVQISVAVSAEIV